MNIMMTIVVSLLLAVSATLTCWAGEMDQETLESDRFLAPFAKLEPERLLLIGASWLTSEDGRQDPEFGIKLIHMAAYKGHVPAQDQLGKMYDGGFWVSKDKTEAAKWFRKAGGAGSTNAQFRLGQMFLKGEGAAKDPEESVKWFRMAAEHGHVDAQLA